MTKFCIASIYQPFLNTSLFLEGSQGGWSLSQHALHEKQEHNLRGCQFISGLTHIQLVFRN